jgi:hypothetical protein
VALFLAYAVSSARLRFAEERLAVHSEVQIPSVQIPDVGFVAGTVDFITGSTVGTAEMGMKSNFYFCLPVDEVMEDHDGHCAYPENPTFIIVEAKRFSTPHEASSEAELLGQLKSHLLRK